MQEDPRFFFFLFIYLFSFLLFLSIYLFIYLLSKSQLRSSFIRLLHLHEKFARDEKFSRRSVSVRACVRACVCM